METLTDNIIDVTLLDPRLKHPTIFERFDLLEEGESLTIHNDHDPKPLFYQMLAERGNVFTWKYLENGPVWWRVFVVKKFAVDADETIGQIAASDWHKAEVFKKNGLDFCCGGKKTVKEACAEKGIDVTKIEQELELADNQSVSLRPLPFNEWALDFLADYIVNTHHSYVQKTLPELVASAQKVRSVHGGAHPELVKLYETVELIQMEMTSHMMKEERVLFPYIKTLVAAEKEGGLSNGSPFGTVQNPVNMMEMEHEVVGKYMEDLRGLTANYTLPEDACASYSLLYKMMETFEEDLHMHIHLENNILFPKAVALEHALNVKNN
jgi:regulator of cell morphogenesis and NO signaling